MENKWLLWTSVIAVEKRWFHRRHWLLWEVIGYFDKFMVAIECQLLLYKPLVATGSHWLLRKYMFVMGMENHRLLRKENCRHRKTLAAIKING
jgi:hypothetical protein